MSLLLRQVAVFELSGVFLSLECSTDGSLEGRCKWAWLSVMSLFSDLGGIEIGYV